MKLKKITQPHYPQMISYYSYHQTTNKSVNFFIICGLTTLTSSYIPSEIPILHALVKIILSNTVVK